MKNTLASFWRGRAKAMKLLSCVFVKSFQYNKTQLPSHFTAAPKTGSRITCNCDNSSTRRHIALIGDVCTEFILYYNSKG